MHLKEKQRFSVSDGEHPGGCDGNAGSENNWKEASVGPRQDLLIQVNSSWGFPFPCMTILKASTSTRKDHAEYFTSFIFLNFSTLW